MESDWTSAVVAGEAVDNGPAETAVAFYAP